MHAKHADNSQLNELSVDVIDCENASAYEGYRTICVFCVHRLSSSALRFFLGLPGRKAGNT
jgi:hypothetical protein